MWQRGNLLNINYPNMTHTSVQGSILFAGQLFQKLVYSSASLCCNHTSLYPLSVFQIMLLSHHNTFYRDVPICTCLYVLSISHVVQVKSVQKPQEQELGFAFVMMSTRLIRMLLTNVPLLDYFFCFHYFSFTIFVVNILCYKLVQHTLYKLYPGAATSW